ncbi:MAG: acyltransferase, partial [Bacteroidales bacterium]
MINEKPKQIGWVDLLRVLACFLVVTAHCCDPFVAQFDNNRFEFLSGTFWGSFVRPCVPLFVMMSGVLLLPVKMSMHNFYIKRMKRVVIPLIIWSLITPLFYFFYLHSGVETLSPNIVMEDHSLRATLTKMYTFIFNFSYSTIPLWYLYMLVGLYLFMPILSGWLASAPKKDIKTFLWIWIFSMIIPYIQMGAPAIGYTGNYGHMGLFGVCDWNPYGTFYYFSGFIGYLVLAHYLVKYPLNWSWGRTFALAGPLFLIGFAITWFGFIFAQNHFPGNYAVLEIVWYFSGINVFFMTFATFIVMQKISIQPSVFMSRMATYTFGIYLCHFLIVQISYDTVYNKLNLPPY